MRLPVVPPISTKDGLSNKNARLTNCLKEIKKGGEKAVVRPGLSLSDTYQGLGSGLIVFDGRLLVVADDTIYGDSEWPLDSPTWAVGTTYDFGDSVWYLGDLYFSMEDGNVGNVPGTSSTWSTSLDETDFDPNTVYGIGDTITINGVTYYSYAENNQNNYPSSGRNSYLWGASPPGSTRVYGRGAGYDTSMRTTPSCASIEAALNYWFGMLTYTSCPGNAYHVWIINQYTIPSLPGVGGSTVSQFNTGFNASPYDCSNQVITGYIDSCTIYRTA